LESLTLEDIKEVAQRYSPWTATCGWCCCRWRKRRQAVSRPSGLPALRRGDDWGVLRLRWNDL
ncbi:MAG: hypothetical protein OXN15_09395, partial [Chloroflexota bacterium]|nr:hypothetical protein [Chloroflexota bacterium]